jgi:hypothetical protein
MDAFFGQCRSITGADRRQGRDVCKCPGDASLHGFTANQIAMATIAKTIAAHTTGVRRFELPLRGESLAARLNS